MSLFTNWNQFAVHQRRAQTGCVPTCYEMLLRSKNAQGINLATFQDDFDLDVNLPTGVAPVNNFDTVAGAVKFKYPNVIFRRKCFSKGRGADKIAFIRQNLSASNIILLSLWQGTIGTPNWHTMPLIGIEPAKLLALYGVDPKGKEDIKVLDDSFLINIHDNHDGGHDVAWLERC